MSSTRVAVRLSDAERNTARFNDSASPPGLYVPDPSFAAYAPYKSGATNMAWWQMPNNVFPMNGPSNPANAPARWYRGAWSSTKSATQLSMVANNGYFQHFGVARSAYLTQIAVYTLSAATATTNLYCRIYMKDTPSGTTSYYPIGGLAAVVSGGTSVNATKLLSFGASPVPLLGGHPYMIGLTADGSWGLPAAGYVIAPRVTPWFGTVSNSTATFYPNAYASTMVTNANGGNVTSGSTISWGSGGTTAQQYPYLFFAQLRTV